MHRKIILIIAAVLLITESGCTQVVEQNHSTGENPSSQSSADESSLPESSNTPNFVTTWFEEELEGEAGNYVDYTAMGKANPPRNHHLLEEWIVAFQSREPSQLITLHTDRTYPYYLRLICDGTDAITMELHTPEEQLKKTIPGVRLAERRYDYIARDDSDENKPFVFAKKGYCNFLFTTIPQSSEEISGLTGEQATQAVKEYLKGFDANFSEEYIYVPDEVNYYMLGEEFFYPIKMYYNEEMLAQDLPLNFCVNVADGSLVFEQSTVNGAWYFCHDQNEQLIIPS